MTLTPELRKLLSGAEHFSVQRYAVLDRVTLHAVMAGLITVELQTLGWTATSRLGAKLTEEGQRELAADRERHPEAYAD